MFGKHFRRLLLIGVSALTLVLATAPASFAGECDPSTGDNCDSTTTTQTVAPPAPAAPAPVVQQSSKSSDTKVAKKGVQTGFGGMSSATGPSALLLLVLGGAGFMLLTSAGAGAVAIRRK
jgi:hypothetical protein